MSRRLAALTVLAFLLAAAGEAAQPRTWRAEGAPALLEADVEGLSIDSEGRVRLAPAVLPIFDPEMPNAWCLASDGKGTSFLGTGNDGRVFRLQAGRGALLFDAAELEAHAVAAAPDGRVYVGTSPDGAVYAVDPQGRAERVFDPAEKYVWALAVAPSGELFVATGGEGRIHRVKRDGSSETVLTTSDTHVLSLAFGPGGELYAGTAPAGILYRLDASGSVVVLLDSPYREIKSILPAPDGTVWAAVVDGEASEAAAAPSPPALPLPTVSTEITVTESGAVVPPSAAPAAAAPGSAAARGAIIRVGPAGDFEAVWSSTEDVPHALADAGADGVLVGTGNRGRIFRVSKARTWALVATLPAEQVTALSSDREGRTLLATSNPARVFSLAARQGEEGRLVLRPQDAGVISSWGRTAWQGSAPPGTEVRLETRSGNTESADETWSGWSAVAATKAAAATSPPARYLQVRLTLKGPGGRSPEVEAVEGAYLQRNLRPVIRSITVHAPGEAFPRPLPVSGEPEILGLEPTVGSGDAPNAPEAVASPFAAFGRKLHRPGLRTFTWQAEDPNGDALVYEVDYRAVGDSRWRPLRRRLGEPVLAWDTRAVPDGRYLLRVAASDAPGNPTALALRGEKESASFEVDNTPPSLEATLVRGRPDRIRATARDDTSPIRLLELSVDAGVFEPVHPVDGIGDSREEGYEIPLDLEPRSGPHVIVLRVLDSLGNAATTRVDIP